MLLVFGILLSLFGIFIVRELLWDSIGAIMSLAGIRLIVKFNVNQSDSAVDDFCNKQASEYYTAKKAIMDSRDDKIVDAVYSSGYCFENIFSARKAIKGKDNVWRSSIFEMSCMFFSEMTVYYCNRKISLITDERSEHQMDFQLQDIQMVCIEELNQSVVVTVAISGNENLYVRCGNREEAAELCGRMKVKEK